MKKYLYALAFFTLFLFPFSGNTASTKASTTHSAVQDQEVLQAVDQTLLLMKEHLDMMQDLAKWKWNHTAPIEDPKTEKMLLEKLFSNHTESAFLKTFFQAQFNVGKMVQIHHFENWVKQDLHLLEDAVEFEMISAKIEALHLKLSDQILKLKPLFENKNYKPLLQARASALLVGAGIDDLARELSIEPLLDLYKGK